jgi:sulfoxide reductase heme-binding subunit YedZ
MAPTARRAVKPLVFLLCLLPLAWIVYDALTGGLGANPIEAVQLRTGRWSLRLLAAALAITPLRRISGLNELIKYRRMLGLFAFFYATLHLANYVVLDMFFDWSDIVEDVIEHPYVTIGLATWVILLPLAITSTRGWVRRLGKRWAKLHRLVYVAAITGTVHYLWAVKKDTFFPLVYLATFAMLLAYRVIAARQRSSRESRRRSDASVAA